MMHTYTFHAMGSKILIAMDTDAATLYQAGLEAASWFEEWEQHFSRFRLTSELSELNLHTGEFWQVSPIFWRVVKLALEVETKTDGLVTPAVLNALEEAGYTVSFEDMAQDIHSYLSHSFTSPSDLHDIEMNESNYSIRLPIGLRLDLGGVVKGWAAQQAMIKLRDAAPVLVDAGGDIAISGPLRDGSPWAIGVSDPIHEGQSLGLVMLKEQGIATSGRDYRRWLKGDQWQHHIIDPRVGHPAETDLMSATLIASDVMEAEAWAKTALILGSQAAVEKLTGIKSLAYLLVLEDGSTIESSQFGNYRWNIKWQTLQNNLSV